MCSNTNDIPTIIKWHELNCFVISGTYWEVGVRALVVLVWLEPFSTQPWPKLAFHPEIHFSPCWWSHLLWSSGKWDLLSFSSRLLFCWKCWITPPPQLFLPACFSNAVTSVEALRLPGFVLWGEREANRGSRWAKWRRAGDTQAW